MLAIVDVMVSRGRFASKVWQGTARVEDGSAPLCESKGERRPPKMANELELRSGHIASFQHEYR